MHTVTVAEETKPFTGEPPANKPVTNEVGSGDCLILIRKAKGNASTRRERFAATFARMDNRPYNPNVETASESIKAIREERGG